MVKQWVLPERGTREEKQEKRTYARVEVLLLVSDLAHCRLWNHVFAHASACREAEALGLSV